MKLRIFMSKINFFDSFRRINLEKFLIQSGRTLALILIYYFFSITVTFFQRSLIRKTHYPFLIVTCHLIIKWFLSFIIRKSYLKFTGHQPIALSCEDNTKKLSIVGIISSLDIGLSNYSFQYITISLYTMTKSTCVVFILILAILFGLEKKRSSLIVIIFLISSGLFMFTYKSTQFDLRGFIIVLTASFLGGLRWTLSQILMQKEDIGLSNPIDMIFHIQPWMLIGILPLTLGLEGSKILNEGFLNVINLNTDLSILIGAIFVFLMEFTEFLLLSYTSCLTLSIAGIFKEIFMIYIAVEFNGDILSLINVIGLFVCLTGITLHVVLKAREATVDGDSEAHSFKRESERLLKIEEDSVLS